VGFELFIAGRYLLARRRQAFISVISLISTLGVTVGVMALIIALALMTGLQRELRDRILGSTAHIYVWHVGEGFDDYQAIVKRITQVKGVLGAAPAVDAVGLLLADDGTQQVISVKGIDPALEPKVTDIGMGGRSNDGGPPLGVLSGSLTAIERVSDEGAPGVLLGKKLAEKVGVRVGDHVKFLTVGSTRLTPGGVQPRARTARVVGTFSLGLADFDTGYVLASLPFAELLKGVERPEQILVKVDDIDNAPAIAKELAATLGPGYSAEEWQRVNKPLFSALWLEKMGLSIAIGLIVMVAALNIVASLILLVMEKSRDIAILKTMGLSSERVMRVFILQGLIIGLTGTIIGAAGGLLVARVLDKYQLIHIDMDVYQVAHVPFVVRPFDLAVILVSAVVICFLATIYPSRQAAKLDPVQALRFE
jgi:lipoprotein-releasing system permease protein